MGILPFKKKKGRLSDEKILLGERSISPGGGPRLGGRGPHCSLPGPWWHMQCLSKPHRAPHLLGPGLGTTPMPFARVATHCLSLVHSTWGVGTPEVRHCSSTSAPSRPSTSWAAPAPSREGGTGVRRGSGETARTLQALPTAGPLPGQVPLPAAPFPSATSPGKLPHDPGWTGPRFCFLCALYDFLAAYDTTVITWVIM